MRLQLCFDPMQQLNNLSTADPDPMQREQLRLDLSKRQTHHHAQSGNQTGQPHSDPSLTYHLLMQVHRGFIPVLAPCTPPFVDTMVRDLHWRGHGHIDDLSATRQADASQPQLTRWAREEPMLYDLGWLRARSRSIVPRVTLLASLLLFLWRFLFMRLDERGRRRFQLLEFLNACLGDSQLLRDFIEPL
jgi:hypothetical protein